MKTKTLIIASALALLGATQSTQAAFLDQPVPGNAYITQNGLDWAWGAPVTFGFGGDGIDLSFQSGFGWRIPTAAELVFAPNAVDFLFPGGNVPYDGVDPVSGADFDFPEPGNYNILQSAGACATPYFNTVWRTCNWRDGRGEPFNRDWAGVPGTQTFYEQLFVRNAIPEPATMLLFGAGFAALGVSRRGKTR